jgi:formylglycine-generating enzyme required for sulfatase activity
VSFDDHPCQDDGSDCGEGEAHPIYARSEAGAMPSAFITWYQAAQACANTGKRLPAMQEWQMAASGTPSGTGAGCNFSGAKTTSGTLADCTSTAGAFDMVGNLWEWSAELSSPPPGVSGSTDSAGAMALGQDFDNTGGGTPSTKSLFIMDGSGDAIDNGPNTSISVLGFRCVQ